MRASTGRSTIIITVLSLISAVLGFGRDAYIAYKFGASGMTDGFYVASVVPDMVAQVIAYALTYAFIPVLKAEIHKSNASAIRLTNAVFWNSTFFLLGVTAVTIWLRGPLIHLLAPGFSVVQSKAASEMLYIMSISVIFCGLSGVLSGIHNANEQFLYPALTGIVNNLCLIMTTVLLTPWMGVVGLACAFSVGYFGRFTVQIIPLLRNRQLCLAFRVRHPSIRKILVSIGPIVFCSGFETINVIVDRILASHLPPGQITILNYASKLGMLPYTLIGSSLATTLYIRFVTHTLDGNRRRLRRLASVGTGWAVFWALVIAAGFVVYGKPLMALLFGHGEFTGQDVSAAVLPLKYYGCFAISYLLPPVLSRFFFARQENWFVTAASFVSVCVNVTGSILFVHPFGICGLILANSLSQLGLVLILGAALVRRLKWGVWAYLQRSISIGAGPGLSFFIGTYIVRVCWGFSGSQSIWVDLFQGATALAVGGLMVLGYAKIRQNNEIGSVVQRGGRLIFFRWRLKNAN